MATARPVVSVYQFDKPEQKKDKTVAIPHVLTAPLRPDLVRFVHTNMAKNSRQAQGVKNEAGYDTAAASWGTGRAVARIPRVPGGGTHRAGQGAFGNMCRGGGMFAPLKTWRRWHRHVNKTQKRHAVASALAASALPALVMARGHRVSAVPELPLVVSDGLQSVTKTKEAVKVLTGLGCGVELEKVRDSKKLRAGKGKMRNRRYTMRRGPLVIYAEDNGISRAVRNIPGVEHAHVERLNLLQLAPGGTFGRLVIWTEAALRKLGELYGSFRGSSALKSGYHLQRPLLANADVARIINSDEVQGVLNAAKGSVRRTKQKKNPLKNKSVLGRVAPGALARKKQRAGQHKKGSKAQLAVEKSVKKRVQQAKDNHKKARARFAKDMAKYETKTTKAAAVEGDEE